MSWALRAPGKTTVLANLVAGDPADGYGVAMIHYKVASRASASVLPTW
jgi:hypothetical protein